MPDIEGQGPDTAESKDTLKTNAPAPDGSEALGDEADTASAADETGAKLDDVKNGVQKRFNELTKQRYEERAGREAAERDAAYWRRRAEDVIREQQSRPPEQKVASEPEEIKSLADFNYDDTKYARYLEQRGNDRLRAELQSQLQQERAQAEQQRKTEQFLQRAREFEKTHDDFRLNDLAASTLPFTKAIADVVLESEQGPEVLYHLKKNPDMVYALSQMSPTSVAREIGRIEARLEFQAKAAKESSAVSKAPPPTPKIDSSSDASPKDPENMSDKEWAKWRENKLKRQKG